MSIDYIVSSLPALAFGVPAPISWERFAEAVGDAADLRRLIGAFDDLETQLRNAVAVARDGAADCRPAVGCSLYWRNRIAACFAERDVLRRDELIDRVWWDAAGELTPPEAPLGRGALATYAVRLRIALRRTLVSEDRGNAAFDRLTAGTKVSF